MHKFHCKGGSTDCECIESQWNPLSECNRCTVAALPCSTKLPSGHPSCCLLPQQLLFTCCCSQSTHTAMSTCATRTSTDCTCRSCCWLLTTAGKTILCKLCCNLCLCACWQQLCGSLSLGAKMPDSNGMTAAARAPHKDMPTQAQVHLSKCFFWFEVSGGPHMAGFLYVCNCGHPRPGNSKQELGVASVLECLL